MMKDNMAKSENDEYSLIVIGGGPAGYVAAIKAAQLGAGVALVEQDTLGGTCLNRGCIPTKAYLKNAEIFEEIKQVNAAFDIDMPATVKMKNKVVRKLTSGVGSLLKSNKEAAADSLGRCLHLPPKVSMPGINK